MSGTEINEPRRAIGRNNPSRISHVCLVAQAHLYVICAGCKPSMLYLLWFPGLR
jgi:hypothetical protein